MTAAIIRRSLVAAACLLAFTACTPQVQEYHPIDAHEGITLRDDTLLASDETILPVKSWLPAGKPQAVIIALHGFNDYSNSFLTTGLFFQAHGVALFAYDQRGFGRAPGTGIWAGEESLIGDLADGVRQAERRYPGAPVYILGESMGGAVAIAAAARPDFPPVAGLILSAPAVWGEETMNPVFRSTLWLAAHTLPTYTLTGSDLKIIASNNIPMLRRLSADPLVLKRTRVDAILGLVRLMDKAHAQIPNIQTPVLLLYGAHDQVIPPTPIENARKRFTIPVTYLYYPDGYHMLTRDIQGEQVMADMLKWMEEPNARFTGKITE